MSTDDGEDWEKWIPDSVVQECLKCSFQDTWGADAAGDEDGDMMSCDRDF